MEPLTWIELGVSAGDSAEVFTLVEELLREEGFEFEMYYNDEG